MPYLVLLLGLVGAAAFWWFRVKAMRDMAVDAADELGRLRGAYRRSRMRSQNEMSPLTAIDDPVIAAATVILAIMAEDEPPPEARLSALTAVLAEVSSPQKADEAMTYAQWANREFLRANTVIDKVGPFLRTSLSAVEKEDLLRMLDRVAQSGSPPIQYRQRVARLRVKLGLQAE